MKVAYEWLKEYIGSGAPSVEEIEKLLTFHAFEIEGTEEVVGMDVIDVDVLPNRSSDCLSHRGIAREIATLTGKALAQDPFVEAPTLTPATEQVQVTVENDKACDRFGLALMKGLTVKESPEWLKNFLTAIGQRPINNIVDATNYVMFALGQPLHAYDANKFEQMNGKWQFGVRMAKEGERVTTLTGEEYELTSHVQLIVNAGAHDLPVGIAGIKGGKYAEVDSSTTSIILEAAHFDPTVIRKASQFLKLQTDASKRFENNVSLNVIPYALTRVVSLLIDIAGGICEGYVDYYPNERKNQSVSVSLGHINNLLGLSLNTKEVSDILDRLGFTVSESNGTFTVTAPFERTDIYIPEDVIEEVGRVYGYEHVTSVTPEKVSLTEINTRQYYSEKVRTILVAQGFSEVITSTFRKKDEIRLQNALASDKGCLRSSLRKNIAEVLDKNITNVDLLGLSDVRVFEIGTVFEKGDGTITEYVSLSLGVRTKQQGYNPKDDAVLQEVQKVIEEQLEVPLEATIEKGVLECNFTTLLAALPLPSGYESHPVSTEIQYKPFSSYPFVSRDIALWVGDGVTAQDVEEVLNNSAGDLRVRTTLFDEFKKDGRVSYAFRLIFQSDTKTLTDDEVNTVIEGVLAALTKNGWEVR